MILDDKRIKIVILELLNELIKDSTETYYDPEDISGLNPRTRFNTEYFFDCVAKKLYELKNE